MLYDYLTIEQLDRQIKEKVKEKGKGRKRNKKTFHCVNFRSLFDKESLPFVCHVSWSGISVGLIASGCRVCFLAQPLYTQGSNSKGGLALSQYVSMHI